MDQDFQILNHPRIQSKSLGHDRGAIYLLLSSHLLFQLSRESFEQVFLIFWRHFKAERCVLYWRKILPTEFQMRWWWWWRAKEEEEASWISARRQVFTAMLEIFTKILIKSWFEFCEECFVTSKYSTLFWKVAFSRWGKNPYFIQKFTYWRSHFLQNSQLWNLIFHKIHLSEISIFIQFTFQKSQFSQNSPF